MKKLIFLFAAVATVVEIVRIAMRESKPEDRRTATLEEHEGYTVTRTPVNGGGEVVRFRGSYDDIMRAFGVVKDEKPPLPDELDIENLPKYWGGCPHCGKTSMLGENMWRYQELSRTRGCYNNTTTYLTKCKQCHGFMKSTVDHDD